MKPQAQEIWETAIKEAVESISFEAEENPENTDIRPKIKDKNSGAHFLIDTGAAISIWPKSNCPNANVRLVKRLESG